MIGALIGVGTILAATYSHSRLFLKAYQYLFPMTQFLSSTRDNLLLLKTILDTLNCRCVLYQMMCSLSECSMEVPQSPESDTTVFAPFSDKLMGALLNVAPTHFGFGLQKHDIGEEEPKVTQNPVITFSILNEVI
ncbi:hypothetical protein CI102_14620 [Trichoderma harzianum]|nr:hypothetical protein CI102_14620 [Trichoderma harzianum]